MIGQVIGNYRLVAELGKGGMGVVYVAEHVQLGRPAALKMLLPQFSSDEAIVQRFFNEARAASAIDHPGIVEIYDFGTHTDGRAYIVMALLKGETLQQRMVRAPLASVEGATIVAQVAGALAVAHARGIVHRDLKPDNIFLVPNELLPFGVQAKLLDFGIAKLADDRASFKTQTGSMIGTPAYMSPEQCMGRSDLDHRTDLYALGCILFHVLCGRPPFISEAGAGPLIAAHLRDPAPDPRLFEATISEPLAHIVLRLLEKDPAARYQTALAVREALMHAGASVSVTRQVEAQPPTRRDAPYRGPDAYLATTAPTTNSGSAAQVVTPPSPRKRGVWIGLAAVAVVGAGVAGFVVFAKPPPAQTVAPAHVVVAPDAAADAAAEVPVAIAPCPTGQSRRPDTFGHCCWDEQGWSSARDRCVGAPKCPAGMLAARDTCVRTPELPATDVPKFTLDAKTYAPGAEMLIQFTKPVPSAGDHRAWVTVVEPSKSKDTYGIWKFIENNARVVRLRAPSTPGSYEVRLHTDYSVRLYNVRYSVPLDVELATTAPPGPATPLAKQTFVLDRSDVIVDDRITLTFPEPLYAAKGERFWVTIVPPDANPNNFGTYLYVPAGAKSIQLRVPTKPDEYEVRLHANYPTKTYNIVHRHALHVR